MAWVFCGIALAGLGWLSIVKVADGVALGEGATLCSQRTIELDECTVDAARKVATSAEELPVLAGWALFAGAGA